MQPSSARLQGALFCDPHTAHTHYHMAGKAAAEGIAMLQSGVTALKYSTSAGGGGSKMNTKKRRLPQAKLFTLSEDQATLSWRGQGLRDSVVSAIGKSHRSRSIRLEDVASISVEQHGSCSTGANISIQLRAEAPRGHGRRASLDVRCPDAVAHARWVSALSALVEQASPAQYVATRKLRERCFGDIREQWMAAREEREQREQEELEAEAMAWAEAEQTLAEAMEHVEAMAASASEWAEAEAEVRHAEVVPVQVVAETRNTSALMRARKATAATKARLAMKMKVPSMAAPSSSSSSSAGTRNMSALRRARASKAKRGA